MQKVKLKLSLIKNPSNLHVHNSLSSVAMRMPYVNIHRVGSYQLEMGFVSAHLPLIEMGNTLHSFDCI